ncbi:MAG: CAAX prenyl protease-related protein [Kiritimatiellae bacterium]|nr:CAAX prenyl protease-related protein [Kiritimatiellia bacterium]
MSEAENAADRPLAEPARKGSPKAKAMTRAAARHAAPFLLWIGAMLLGNMMHLTPGSATGETPSLDLLSDAALYAVQTALALGALLLLRPWVHHKGCFSPRHVLPALAVGAGVFALWVLPGSDFFRGLWPAGADLWEKFCVWPLGEARDVAEAAAETAAKYAPAASGWPLWCVHMLGTGVAIAVAEEFFWRAYLLRAARTPDFLDLPVGSFHAFSFFAVTAVFAAEHAEWAAGFAAGLAYGLLFIRTRDVWAACIAHGATNALLGFYVLSTGHWEFW